jgi:(S)-2-hydroxyglutarate dehydrogenase
MAAERFDAMIVGGGIVGLAAAYQLTERFPECRLLVLEKEGAVGAHQTGHNSGVLHSGIYYKPGSLKATNCREGKQLMETFCAQHDIAHDVCGKVIVAVSETEVPVLERIYERGQQNQVRCQMIGAERLRELEPHAAGVRAIHVPEAGIVNFRQVCEKLRALVEQRGGRVVFGAKVDRIRRQGGEVVASTGSAGEFVASYLVNCAGLHCDRVTALSGVRPPAKIVPFRGEYYELKPDAHYLCRNLIYPVPDPSFPFLGVHFTRMIDGSVECGPNAVLAFAREGYRKRDISLGDLWESLTYPGFLRLCRRYWRVGLGEMWRSVSKRAFVRALQRLVPEIRSEQLVPARAGVRAQAISHDGAMVDDFLICAEERIVNVCNAPSPAATSSLNIGRLIVDKLAQQMVDDGKAECEATA